MGLFDALTNGTQGYGGLLDFLQSQMQQQYPQAGNYPPPPASFADRFNALPSDQPRYNAAQSAYEPPPASFAQRFDALPPAAPVPMPAPRPADPRDSFAQRFEPAYDQPSGYMQIGDYRMPQFGPRELYQSQPQQAQLPANSQPVQAQGMPPQLAAAQQPEQLPPAFGAPRRFSDLLMGKDFNAAADNAANLTAQYQATKDILMQGGMKPNEAASKAMLAMMDPEARKTIIPEALTGKEKFGVVKDDPLSGKEYGFYNEREQTVNGKPISGQPAQQGGLQGIAEAQARGVTGQALYDYLPKSMAPTVKAMIEGRQPLPSTTAMRSPATLALIDAAHAIDPTFDATVWKSRNEAGPDWTKGKSAEMVRSANQTLAHVGSLMSAMDDLKNTRFPIANAIGNSVRENLGSGEQGAFRTNAHAVAEEMSKVFKGANLSDAEIRHWEQNLSENMSPEQQRAQIAKLSELLHGSLQALEEKRVAAMGPVQAAKMGPIIKEEGQAVLKRIDEWVKKNGGSAAGGGFQEGQTATNPQTGQKLTFRGGKWQ